MKLKEFNYTNTLLDLIKIYKTEFNKEYIRSICNSTNTEMFFNFRFSNISSSFIFVLENEYDVVTIYKHFKIYPISNGRHNRLLTLIEEYIIDVYKQNNPVFNKVREYNVGKKKSSFMLFQDNFTMSYSNMDSVDRLENTLKEIFIDLLPDSFQDDMNKLRLNIIAKRL